MRKEIRLHEIRAPSYDCNREPIMDVNRIRELLPHRYPFQLVDKVIEIGANYIVEMCIRDSADGAGTKSSLAYMYWKETGDLSV